MTNATVATDPTELDQTVLGSGSGTGGGGSGGGGRGRARRPLGRSGIAIAVVVPVVVGLLAWGAYEDWYAQRPQTFYSSSVQPYYIAPATPVVPANTPTAHGATVASQKAAMTTTTPHADVTLEVNAPPLGGIYGSDGQVHDAFTPAYFAVPVGHTVHVTVYSYDTAWHTFSAPTLGLSVWIRPSATGSKPAKTTFSFTAPKTGYYYWLCELPCDPYSMSSGGYMEGEIHAVG